MGTTNYLSRGDFKNHDIDVALSGEGFRSCDINVALQRDESRVTSINSPLERGASAGGGVCDSSISEVSNYRVYTIPQLPEYSEEEKLLNEMSTLDVAISHHPLFLYKDLRNICGATSLPIGSHEINLVLRQDSLISSIEMKRYINKKVRMVGWMVTNRRVYAVRGEYMKFLTLEDWDGIYEAVLFPKTYQQYGDLVITRGPYIITGKINNEYGYQTINVDEVELVSDKHLELTEIIKTSESKFL